MAISKPEIIKAQDGTGLLCNVANIACHALVARTEKERYDAATLIARMIAKAHRRTCAKCGQRFRRRDKYHKVNGTQREHYDCTHTSSY